MAENQEACSKSQVRCIVGNLHLLVEDILSEYFRFVVMDCGLWRRLPRAS